VLHQIRHAGILAQQPAAGHNHWRYAFAIQVRRVKGAIPRVIVVTKDDQHIGLRDWLIHYPELRRKTHHWIPDTVEEDEKSKNKQQE
jgi:hypothetical protein